MAGRLPGYYWGFGGEETRDTNVIMEKAAEEACLLYTSDAADE